MFSKQPRGWWGWSSVSEARRRDWQGGHSGRLRSYLCATVGPELACRVSEGKLSCRHMISQLQEELMASCLLRPCPGPERTSSTTGLLLHTCPLPETHPCFILSSTGGGGLQENTGSKRSRAGSDKHPATSGPGRTGQVGLWLRREKSASDPWCSEV